MTSRPPLLGVVAAAPARAARWLLEATGATADRALDRQPRRVLALGLALGMALAAAPGLAAEALNRATDLRVAPLGEQGGAEVAVTFTAQPHYTARVELAGRRLVVDVSNAVVRGAKEAIGEPVGVVSGVLAQTFSVGGKQTTRVLVNLARGASYDVAVDGNRLLIRLTPGEPGPAPRGSAAPAPVAKAAARGDASAAVLDVRFAHERLRDQVRLQVSHFPSHRRPTLVGGRASLTLESTELAERLQRTLDVSAFGGLVAAVSAYHPKGRPDRVVLEAEVADGTASEVTREGRELVWSFFRPGSLPSSMTGLGQDGKVARRARTLHVEDPLAGLPGLAGSVRPVSAGDVQETRAEADGAAAFTPALMAQQAGRYGGRRIDLDLKDADIHNVLRLLADVGRVNIVTADNVSGNVSIRMRNIPWDQAMDVILQSKGLGREQRGNIIRVAPQETLEKEREQALARQKQMAQLEPLETRIIPISYADADDMQSRAKDLLSPRGTVAVDERTNVMIVRDLAGNLDQIEELTRTLDTQTPQVLVEARIVEATSRYLRDVGIQWGGDAAFSAATGNPTGLAFPNAIGLAGGASDGNTPTAGLSPFQNSVSNPNFAVNLPAAVGTGQGGAVGLTFGSVDNNFNLNLRLSAAEATGMLRVLSSPRILTLDNMEASISQGTMIPFSQVSAQGVQTTFQEARLELKVTPHVTAEGSVAMKVAVSRNEPDFNQTSARGDPTILKRQAQTTLLVQDGDTAVIGGIYTRNTGRNVAQVPFFGDIPLLGLLFQKRTASDTRGELVIFLTPRIVNRAEALGR